MRRLIYKYTLYAKLFLKNLIGGRLQITYTNSISADLLEEIFRERGPVVIVRNFIPKEKLPGILEHLEKSKTDMIEMNAFGYCYGFNLTSANGFDNYLKWEPSYSQYLQETGLDYDEAIRAKLDPAGTLPVERASHEGKKYFSSTIRFLQPHKGGIKPHTELLHYDLYGNCKHIASQLDLSNEISAFCILQKPDAGGHLCIFNCTFNETQEIPYEELRYNYVLWSGYTIVDPEPGDLILFGGGQRWHCITEIEGKTDRITIGNFFGFDKAHTKVLYWS